MVVASKRSIAEDVAARLQARTGCVLRVCRFGKGLRVQHRKGMMKKNAHAPEKDGDLMTCDYMILKSKMKSTISS